MSSLNVSQVNTVREVANRYGVGILEAKSDNNGRVLLPVKGVNNGVHYLPVDVSKQITVREIAEAALGLGGVFLDRPLPEIRGLDRRFGM